MGKGQDSAHKIIRISKLSDVTGGEGGIRTPGTLAGTTDFESAAIDHSATSPRDANFIRAG